MEAHCDFAKKDHVKMQYFYYISKVCTVSHKPFWLHQYLCFPGMGKRIVGIQQDLSAEGWKKIQSASFQLSKMALVTSIRKNKDFQMEGKQIIGKQEKGVHF